MKTATSDKIAAANALSRCKAIARSQDSGWATPAEAHPQDRKIGYRDKVQKGR